MVTIASHFSGKRLASDDDVCGRAFAPILINPHNANGVVLGTLNAVDGLNSLLGSEQNTGFLGWRKCQFRRRADVWERREQPAPSSEAAEAGDGAHS